MGVLGYSGGGAASALTPAQLAQLGLGPSPAINPNPNAPTPQTTITPAQGGLPPSTQAGYGVLAPPGANGIVPANTSIDYSNGAQTTIVPVTGALSAPLNEIPGYATPTITASPGTSGFDTQPTTSSGTNPLLSANGATTAQTAATPPSLTSLGGGWSQYATDPTTPQGALAALLAQGITGQAAVDKLNQNPATAGIEYYANSGEYGLPDGYYAAPNSSGTVDLIQRSAEGGSSAASSPVTASTLALPSMPALSVQGASSPGGTSALDAAYTQAILNLMQTSAQPVTAASIAASPQMAAEQIQSTRSAQAQDATIAEQAAAGGYAGSGAQNAEEQGVAQAAGQSDAEFAGTLATSIMQQNAQQLETAIQDAEAQGQFDAAQQLQVQLADLNASIEQQQLGQQNTQFGLTLGYNYAALQEAANQAATMAALNG